MALTVEDGTVVENANSYVSAADCTTYHTALGNTTWTGTDAAKEAAILRAMEWIESRPWRGVKTDYDNPLSWPRSGVADSDGYAVPEDEVPSGVVKALCEAALIEISDAGALRPSLKRGGEVQSFSIPGVISKTFKSSAPATTTYHTIVGPLRGLVRCSSCVKVEQG